ncbi:MAG: aldo/keto reductase [Anaerolineales bacterium]|nr:aldo/keto reductase [Anaerolineales bacterium]
MTEKRKLGNSNLHISSIGLGVMQFAGGKGMFRTIFNHFGQEVKDRIVRAALDGGINWFDTAEIYGYGRSEKTLRDALVNNQVRDEDVLIASKWWPFPRFANNIRRTAGKRLANLSPYTLDLHQVHWPHSFSSPEAQMDAMADLVEGGRIRAVGVSNFNEEYTYRAHNALAKRGLGLASNQVQFSLVHREIEHNGVLKAAKELGVTIIAWSPLASGLLSGKFHKDQEILANTPATRRRRLAAQLERTQPLIEVLDELAHRHDKSITQVVLNWTIHFHGDTVAAIPGASQVKHAREAAGVLDFRLTDAEMAKLDEISR